MAAIGTHMEGTFKKCSRCKGTGQARYNHLNGDTHCYLCNGRGLQYRPTPAEKARQAEFDSWVSGVHHRVVGGYHSFRNQIRRPVGATRTTEWVNEAGRAAMSADELAAYEAARTADFKAAARLERTITAWVSIESDGILGDMCREVGEAQRAHEAAEYRKARTEILGAA